jgi:hypothetical protein
LDTVWESRRVRDSKPYPGRIQPWWKEKLDEQWVDIACK